MNEFISDTPIGDVKRFISLYTRRKNHAPDYSRPEDAVQRESASFHEFCIDCTGPKQWPMSKKIRVVAIVSFYTSVMLILKVVY